MMVLVTHLATTLDPLGPVNQKRVADAAVVAIALPHLERRIASHRPAGGVMVVRPGATQHIQELEVLFQAIRNTVGYFVLVDRAGGATLTTGAILGDRDDECVVELTRLFQKVDNPSDLVVGVA